MTIRPLSRQEVRNLDGFAEDNLGIPLVVLMENAGRGAAEVLRKRLAPPGRVVVACGRGNNGGDGAVLARHLDGEGFRVRVVWFADPPFLTPLASDQRYILRAAGIDNVLWPPEVEAGTETAPPVWPFPGVPFPDAEPLRRELEAFWAEADWLVDGLLGTGLSRPVKGLLAGVIDSMNRSGKPILALDLPSGLDADTGRPLGPTIRAVTTATFVAPKLGFDAPGASDYTGQVEVIPIGLPRCLLDPYRLDTPAGPATCTPPQ